MSLHAVKSEVLSIDASLHPLPEEDEETAGL